MGVYEWVYEYEATMLNSGVRTRLHAETNRLQYLEFTDGPRLRTATEQQ